MKIKKESNKRRRQKLFLNNYEDSLFNISTACRKTDINRWTFYSWEKKDKWFNRELHILMERDKDLIETKIRSMALQGDRFLLKFYAKCKMKDRGYVDRQELEITDANNTAEDFASVWKKIKKKEEEEKAKKK